MPSARRSSEGGAGVQLSSQGDGASDARGGGGRDLERVI